MSTTGHSFRGPEMKGLTSPSISERLCDDLMFVFVNDVTEALLAKHRHVVSVGLKYHPQVLRSGDVVAGGLAEPCNASGLPPLVALRASPVEPSRLGEVLSKPRKGVAKRGTVGFWNIRSLSQPTRRLKET